MIRSLVLSLTLAATLLVGCDDPAANKPAATTAPATSAAAAAKPAAATPAAAKKYSFSGEGSKVEFVGSKITGSHPGGFKTFTGTVEASPSAIEQGKVSVEIDMASVYSDSEKLTGHLQAADFFDVAKFPKGKFTSTTIAKSTDGKSTHTVTGNLELHGVTKSISFPATIAVTADAVTVTAEFTINRKEFGIAYEGMKDDLIRDEVVIKLTIAGKPS